MRHKFLLEITLHPLLFQFFGYSFMTLTFFSDLKQSISVYYRFYSETLWSEIKDEEDIADVTSTWMITLEKKGCNIIVRAGTFIIHYILFGSIF